MEQRSVRKPRAILTEQQAVDIFKWQSAEEIPTMVSSSSFIAKKFGINERTVRDIWKRRTWAHATWRLGERADTKPMVKKRTGRPKGSKDSRPRQRKLNSGTPISPEYQQGHGYSSQTQTTNTNPASMEPLPGTLPLQQGLPIKEESIDDQLHSWTFHNSNWIEYAQTTCRLD